MMRKIHRLSLWRAPLVMILGGGAVLLLLGGGEQSVSGEEKAAAAPVPQASASPAVSDGGGEAEKKAGKVATSESESSCLVDETALEDLKKQREALQTRQKELATKENELKARELALNEEFRKFEVLRGDVGKVDAARKQENDARVTKLVETFETMSPKAAAQVLAGLDESLAVAAMAKIATPKLAKIMNVMEPKRSARLTELMAGVVRAREAAPRRPNAVSNDMDETTTVPAVPAPRGGVTGGKDIRKGGERT